MVCSRVLQVEHVFYICGTPGTWYKSEFPWLWKGKRKNVIAWKYYLSFWEDRIHLSIVYLVTFCECDCSVEGLYVYFLRSLVYPCFTPFHRWGNRSSVKLRTWFSVTVLLEGNVLVGVYSAHTMLGAFLSTLCVYLHNTWRK